MIYLDPKHARLYADTRDELDEAARMVSASFTRLVGHRLDLTERQARKIAPSARFVDGRTASRIVMRSRREEFRVGYALHIWAGLFLYLVGAI